METLPKNVAVSIVARKRAREPGPAKFRLLCHIGIVLTRRQHANRVKEEAVRIVGKIDSESLCGPPASNYNRYCTGRKLYAENS